MKIEISRELFNFELEQLCATKQGFAQFAFIQFILWFSSFKQAPVLFPGVADYWSNYILLNGFCLGLVLNSMIATEIFVKPKAQKTIEMLLAGGLRPQTIAVTNVAVGATYNCISLLLSFVLLALTIGKTQFAWIHVVSFLTLALANLVSLVWTAFFSLQTQHGPHIASGFLLCAVVLLFAASYYRVSLNTTMSFQSVLGVFMALLASLSTVLFTFLDKERILIS